MVDTRKGYHRVWFINEKVLGAIKDKWQHLATKSLGIIIIIRTVKVSVVGKGR